MAANNYGSGVSRVLDPRAAGFLAALHQQGKPPTDAEINLLQDIQNEWNRLTVLRGVPSGFLGNETSPYADFQTSAAWSNWLRFGRQRSGETQSMMWAVVNGWLIPVTGTRTGTPPGSPSDVDTTNIIALDPPPANSGDFRIDFTFLEVWMARVPPSPSTQNKPASTALWKYGNVEGGFSFLPDDLVDPNFGFETTQRVQLQYRLRVTKGLVGLSTNPDGFDAAVVKAQGTATQPTSFSFQNMRSTLGDPGLWRAGDGTANALGTVDGYVYAIPIAAVFRRNGVAWTGDPSPNLNGGFNRNPTATDRTGILTFSTTPALASSIAAAATSFALVSSANIPLPASPASPVLIKIGQEYMTYTSITGTTVNGVVRGLNGSLAETHPANATLQPVSGRPDGLFADQIATTDVLDLRHLVNPNGFDYEALLRGNLDKLLRGRMRSTWKRTGAGPQGPLVTYQDKVSTSAAALGVTKIDGPDNIRSVFSDASVVQPVTVVVKAGTTASIGQTWSFALTANHTLKANTSAFSDLDRIVIPIAQFKSTLGSDSDQVRFLSSVDAASAVEIRIDGETDPIPSAYYVVEVDQVTTGVTTFTSADDLRIRFLTSVPGFTSPSTKQLYIKLHVVYGPGRGVARRPDIVHSVAYTTTNTDILVSPQAVPSSNFALNAGWLPLWSQIRGSVFRGSLPSTTECYIDPGSKSLVLQPYRRIVWPTEFITMDGSVANVSPTAFAAAATGSSNGTTTFSDSSATFLPIGTDGAILTLTSGPNTGTSYRVQGSSTTTLTLNTAVPGTATGISYTVQWAQGVMPLKKKDGTTAKWTKTDPLGFFSGVQDPSIETKNMFVMLPRHLIPGWGSVHVPILPADGATFDEGINFMFRSVKKASPFDASEKNFVPYGNNGALTYAAFSTKDFNPPGNTATYNDTFTFGGASYGGIRLFTDTRGLNRRGLELPPFYGIARLFAVYEATDYQNNGSAYSQTTREATGSGAKNLLKQSFDGPTFWIEIDEDGDSTFVLNADVLDLSKSPNPISTFASGNYVIEANIFGFDRDTFDITKPCRIVLTRAIPGQITNDFMRAQANGASRGPNLKVAITGPISVLPGPPLGTDQIVINYSRTPYQGDAWGSQGSNLDIGFTPGPIQSGSAYQITSTSLDSTALTRPNQKPLEVLASIGFETTLGTGRISGDTVSTSTLDVRNAGYEDPAAYPPALSNSTRPRSLVGALAVATEIGTDYHGCIERLPLGALFRDKDFRGGPSTVGGSLSPLVYTGATGVGSLGSGLASVTGSELVEVAVASASNVTGAPGDVVVHVDGEQGNYAVLTNFRTNRGGSAFSASGAHPGGEVFVEQGSLTDASAKTNVLSGRAFLVRNTLTSVGANEVSSGDELMMLVVTNVQRLTTTSTVSAVTRVGTNGTGEGYAAADLYRIEGHPLVCDNIKMDVDPSAITLTNKVT